MELSFIDITDLNNSSLLDIAPLCQSMDKFCLVAEHSVKVMDFERNLMSTSVLPGNKSDACYLETCPASLWFRGVSLLNDSSREIQVGL
jgi:hypothetical protein